MCREEEEKEKRREKRKRREKEEKRRGKVQDRHYCMLSIVNGSISNAKFKGFIVAEELIQFPSVLFHGVRPSSALAKKQRRAPLLR